MPLLSEDNICNRPIQRISLKKTILYFDFISDVFVSASKKSAKK